MGFGSKLKWIIATLLLLVVLVFVGWGLSSIARSVFNKKSDTPTTVNIEENTTNLDDVKVVRYIVDGPIVASSEHRSYAIEVTAQTVKMKVFSDYGLKVVAEKSYVNNVQSYDNFIKSLEKAKALDRYAGTTSDDDYMDEGSCPRGKRYILEVGDNERRWTDSCDRADGTAAGMMTTMRVLFAKQVPDFDELVKNTGLTL
ncbi:hypothetical protein KC960_00655 [Candidatus Saccharibacteria bacterium]|nr:hypothetical protein [Candidatus Saccharibacteria bacterium]